MKVAVVGTGYVGLVTGTCFAEVGINVVCIDIDVNKIENLKKGILPIYEPGLEEMVERNFKKGRLQFSSNLAESIVGCEAAFIAVGTPPDEDGSADMQYVLAVAKSIAAHMSSYSVIVNKSTVPVGTAAVLAEQLALTAPTAEVAWNPEFLREGFAVADTLHPDRLVVGVRSQRAEDLLREVYAPLIAQDVPFLVTDFPTAELVKVAANSFLATKISFINAMAEVCEAAGADITQLAEAIGYDPRIGNRFLAAGLGFGGGCLPKDIRAFMARAGELGANQALTFLREVDSINMRRRTRMVELAATACGGSLLGANVAVLGAAFKPESDDVRDSPALNVAGMLQLNGATVNVYDPKAMDNSQRLFPTLNYSTSVLEACERADAVLVLTEWREFVDLDPDVLAATVRAKVIVDGRNCLDGQRWTTAGWTYHALGRRAGVGAVR